MSTVHKNLTGADLHEPKGVETALSGSVYVSNGLGSGIWQPASSIIANSAFSTGDLKPTHKLTADTGWIMWQEGSIGDGSSPASLRGNADTFALYSLYWSYNYTGISVSGGRGVSAAADFSAHKSLRLPPGPGRALMVAGAGSGLTARVLAETSGTETITLAANQIPSLASSGTNSITVVSTTANTATGVIQSANVTGGADRAFTSTGVNATISSTGSNNISVNYTNASLQTVPTLSPVTFINVMIKL